MKDTGKNHVYNSISYPKQQDQDGSKSTLYTSMRPAQARSILNPKSSMKSKKKTVYEPNQRQDLTFDSALDRDTSITPPRSVDRVNAAASGTSGKARKIPNEKGTLS